MHEKPVSEGQVESKRKNYFNSSCLTTPPVIGADDIGTCVWKQPNRIVDGPGQENIDLAFSKTVAMNWPVEKSSLRFRGEFYKLNHPQFSNPDANIADVRRHHRHNCESAGRTASVEV